MPRPLYLLTDAALPPRLSPRSVHHRMGELRAKLVACVEEANALESEMLELTLVGVLRDYGDMWFDAVKEGASPAILDILTSSALNNLPVQVANAQEWNDLLRRHTTILLDLIDGGMSASFERVRGRTP